MKNDLWNEICFELNECRKNNALEKDYENAVVNCMMLLGWKKFKGEIECQYPVQAGHETKYADIVILKDGTEQFAIEIKRPSHILQDQDEKQLFSYMRLLKSKVSFGLYIGNIIRLYYDDSDSQQFPEPVFSLKISEDNPDGIIFTELFSKETFDGQRLADFCKKQKSRILEKRKIQEEIKRLLSDNTGEIFKDLLRNKYLEEGHSEGWADAILSQIIINVLPLVNTPVLNPVHVPESGSRTDKTRVYDKTRYGLLGSRPLPKNRFVLETVRQFVRCNPEKYMTYERIFNRLREDSQKVILPINSLTEEQRLRRYFSHEPDWLTSTDGVTFVVNNQWTYWNIGPVVKFAQEQGYDVIEYK